jgi:outer membrane protein assembly factor BamE
MVHHIATPEPMSAKLHYGIRTALKVCALTALSCMVLAGCSSLSTTAVNPVNWITPYRVDVIQGNFISSEQVAMLKTGMTRAQVKDLLGTPLLSSLFHADRWDYVFTLKRQGVEPQSLKYTVFFKDELLERFEGDTMPSEAEFISKLDSGRKLGKVPPLEASEEQLKAAEKPSTAKTAAAAPAAAADAAAAPVSYPPLEGAAR